MKRNLKQQKLCKNELEALTELKQCLMSKFGQFILDLWLFGSKTRGDSSQFSDLDVFILIKKNRDEIVRYLDKISSELNLKYDVVIIPIVYEKVEFEDPINQSTNFLKNVLKEGITL